MDAVAFLQRLTQWVGPETLEAEQALAANQPGQYDNWAQKFLRTVSPRHRLQGNLEPEYWPGRGGVFPLPCRLVPAEEARVAELAGLPWKALLTVERGGRPFYRWFFHPAEKESFQRASRYEEDPVRWLATPTSSNRTLLTYCPDEPEVGPFFLKLSLSRILFGFPRIVEAEHAARAVTITSLVDEARHRSANEWWLFPESFGFSPPEGPGGYIGRAFPPEAAIPGDFFLPYYSLLSPRKEGRWMDLLAEAAGKPVEDFLRQDLAEPLLHLYEDLALGAGIPPELHKQNVGLAVDRSSRRIRSLYLRDMDGLTVDLPLRHKLGLADPQLPPWAGDPDRLLRVRESQLAQAFYFAYLGSMNLEQLAKGVLSTRKAYCLLHDLNRSFYQRLSRRLGWSVDSLPALHRAWEREHHRLSPPTAALVSSRSRLSAALYAHVRQWEIDVFRRFSPR